MSKKLYTLISTCIGSAGAIAAAIVAYVNPAYEAAIVASIGIGCTAINEILVQFVKS